VLTQIISTYFTDRSGVVRYKNGTTLFTYSEEVERGQTKEGKEGKLNFLFNCFSFW
jgi:hypothetical protein